jgi:hypothetical protein
MGYMKISNLYKDDRIFKFEECFALEKVHGTSAHIRYKHHTPEGEFDVNAEELTFFSGGEKYENFVLLFNQPQLLNLLSSFGQDEIIIYGEAYGGKQQGMRDTYGPELKFVAFDVRMNGNWVNVPQAEMLVNYCKLEFVSYARIKVTLEELDKQRDADSVQAIRNGMGEGHKREGIVIRPIEETYDDRGDRIITKHKRNEFMETKTPRQVDPAKLKVLSEAKAIAEEWVTPMRLQHVLDAATRIINATEGITNDCKALSSEDTKIIIEMMKEDIKREAKGEIVESEAASKAIGNRTAFLYKQYLIERLKEQHNGK